MYCWEESRGIPSHFDWLVHPGTPDGSCRETPWSSYIAWENSMNGRFDETGIAKESNQDRSLAIKEKGPWVEHLPSDKHTPVQRGGTKLHGPRESWRRKGEGFGFKPMGIIPRSLERPGARTAQGCGYKWSCLNHMRLIERQSQHVLL